MKSVAAHSPPALSAEKAGERIGDGVDVGRNIKAPPLVVVTGVHDDRKFFGRHNAAKAVHEFRAAGTAREHDDHAAVLGIALASPSAAADARSRDASGSRAVLNRDRNSG